MYYLANEVVSLFGAENTLVLAFGGMLFVVYAVWGRLNTPPSRIWRLAIWLPALLGFWFAYSGWSHFSKLMSMLEQTNAVTNEQHALLTGTSQSQTAVTICTGVAMSIFLWWFVRRNLRRSNTKLAGAIEKENAEPI